MTTETVPRSCWNCGYVANMNTSIFEKARPTEGDVTLCIKCAAISVYNKDLTVHQPTPEEINRLKSNREAWAQILKAVTAIMMTQLKIKTQRKQWN